MDQTKYILYLLGYETEGLGRLVTPDDERLALLATPFRRHLNEVNRFLFNGGVVVDTREQGPKQTWIKEQVKKIKLATLLDNLWEECAIHGKIAIGLHPNGKGLYDTPTTPYFDVKESDSGELESALLYAFKEDKVHVTEYTKSQYIVYAPIPVEEHWQGKRGKRKAYDHNYGFVPVQIVRNTRQGSPEFDQAAIDMAVEIAVLSSSAAENFYYFGHQLIASPNKQEMLTAIANRTRVVTQESEKDGGPPTVLDMAPTPDTFLKFLENLNANLAEHLGSPIVKLNLRSDLSSLTLKLTHGATIATATKKWQAFITEGLEPLFGKMLLMQAYEGRLGGVYIDEPDTYQVDIMRAQSLFQKSALESTQQLEVVDRLISLGIRPTYALAEEYYTHLTEEQVAGLFEPA